MCTFIHYTVIEGISRSWGTLISLEGEDLVCVRLCFVLFRYLHEQWQSYLEEGSI